jgi:hypothetical protein
MGLARQDDDIGRLIRFRNPEGVTFTVDHEHAGPGAAQLAVA